MGLIVIEPLDVLTFLFFFNICQFCLLHDLSHDLPSLPGVCECVIGVDEHERAPPMERPLWRRRVEEEDVSELLHVEVIVSLYRVSCLCPFLFISLISKSSLPPKRVQYRGSFCMEIHPNPDPELSSRALHSLFPIPYCIIYRRFSYPHLFNYLCFCRNFTISLGNLTKTFAPFSGTPHIFFSSSLLANLVNAVNTYIIMFY